jgi:hypothetical protein
MQLTFGAPPSLYLTRMQFSTMHRPANAVPRDLVLAAMQPDVGRARARPSAPGHLRARARPRARAPSALQGS